jgi:hypothetical protein
MFKIITAAIVIFVCTVPTVTTQKLEPPFPVSYCQNDPGDHPNLQTILDFHFGRTPHCNPPLGYSLICLNQKVLEYQDIIYALDKTRRMAICDCWKNHPTNQIARDECIALAEDLFDVGVEAAEVYFDLSLYECCNANP